MIPTMLSFWGWHWNDNMRDWNRDHHFDGSYHIASGYIYNSQFGVTKPLDKSSSPFLIVHLQSGAALVWAKSLSNAIDIIDDGLMELDGWNRTDPEVVRDDVYKGDMRYKLDKIRGNSVPTFLY